MSNNITQNYTLLEALISSKTRIKLLLKFFLNSNASGYLRSIQQEFGDSSNGIRLELNRFEEAGLIRSYYKGNKKYYQVDDQHPLYTEIHGIILKYVGLDKILANVISNLGKIEKVFLVGELAKGLDSPVIDLILIGAIDKLYLFSLIDKVEKVISRKIKYVIYDKMDEFDLNSYSADAVLIWEE